MATMMTLPVNSQPSRARFTASSGRTEFMASLIMQSASRLKVFMSRPVSGLLSDADSCQVLVVFCDGAVILLASLVVVEPLEYLLDLSGHGNGCAH